LRYSFYLDKVEKLSSLSSPNYAGLSPIAKDGTTIYHFGGVASKRNVYKFDSLINVTVRLITDLSSDVYFSGAVSMSGTIYLFDRRTRKIMEFSEESGTA
jgi:hypothetical protein